MKLDDYLKQQDMTSKAFADLVGASQAQIHKIRTGKSGTSLQLAAIIEKETKGKVTALELAKLKPEARAR